MHVAPSPRATRPAASIVAAGLALTLAMTACGASDPTGATPPTSSPIPGPTTVAAPSTASEPSPASTGPATTTAPATTVHSTAAPSTTTAATTVTTDLGAWRAVLQDVADRHLADGEIVGAVLGLRDVGGGTVVVPVGTQTIDAASPPVDPTIPWGIGSITKTFVAVVVLQLAEEGRLDLDAGIDGYVPTLADAALITPRELLQHTSGLNEYINSAEVLNGGARTWTVGELVGIAERAGRVGEPGEMHSYANTNYLLLGEIIEQVTGRPWFDAVKERIVEPLGLTGTSVISSDSAPGYASVDGQWVDQSGGWDPSVGGAAGALQSTAGDLLTFGRALADGVLLDAESAAAMQTFIPADDLSAYGVDHGYGLGLERYAGAEVTTFGHLGVGQTQSAFFGYDVDSGTAVVVLMNTTVPGPQAVMAVEALTAISPLD